MTESLGTPWRKHAVEKLGRQLCLGRFRELVRDDECLDQVSRDAGFIGEEGCILMLTVFG